MSDVFQQPQRVLVVDDDPRILSMLRRGLSLAGYSVDLAADGDEALSTARESPPDIVILDVMLPEIDGLEVCRRLRASDRNLPILMLTARGRVPDRVAGLDAGADDYLVKPFAFDELLARIRALLRRRHDDQVTPADVIEFGELRLNPSTREVSRAGVTIDLTVREFDLLEFLMRNARQVFSRDAIFERVWASDFAGESNVIDVHVMRLRDKLEARGRPRLIHTVRGVGYVLREAVESGSR
jgi:two-component system, OmpR family, response regulator MprA